MRARAVRWGLTMVIAVSLPSLAGCVADAPPAIGAATAGDGRATVSWSPPIDDNGSLITQYVVTPWVGTVP